jgi:hypothetical protein
MYATVTKGNNLLTDSDYRMLRGFAMRQVFGNAGKVDGKRSAKEFVKAGSDANGIRVTREAMGTIPLIDEGVSNACIVLAEWRMNGLPPKMQEILDDMREIATEEMLNGDERELTADERDEIKGKVDRAIYGAAVRNGIRDVSLNKRPSATATRERAYRALITQDPDNADRLKRPVPVSVSRTEYIGTAQTDPFTEGCIALKADGTFAFPMLARYAFTGGNMSECASLAYGSTSGPARTRVKRRLIAEWSAMADGQPSYVTDVDWQDVSG